MHLLPTNVSRLRCRCVEGCVGTDSVSHYSPPSWQVNERRDECKRFESTWVSAVTLCEAAAEAAYTSGALKGRGMFAVVRQCELLGWHVVMSRQVFSGLRWGWIEALHPESSPQKLLKLMFISFSVQQLSALHFPQYPDHWCHSGSLWVKLKGDDGHECLV